MAETSTIQINGIKTRERVIGGGTPVVMTHGWGANIDLLQPLALPLSRLGYRCHMFDLPGFGESAEPERAFTIFDYADFVIAYMDERKLERAHYFGHSLGGRIGLILGAQQPNRLEKMALSNSAGIRSPSPKSAQLRLKLYRSLRGSLEALGASAVSQRLRQRYNQRYGSDDFLSASPVMRASLIHVVNEDLLGFARRVGVPTILIWGDQDRETPLWMGEKLERAIPDAALITHTGASHYAYLERVEETAAILHALFGSD